MEKARIRLRFITNRASRMLTGDLPLNNKALKLLEAQIAEIRKEIKEDAVTKAA